MGTRRRYWVALAISIAACGRNTEEVEQRKAALASQCPGNVCKLEFTVPETVPLNQLAAVASQDLYINDRASLDGYDGTTPVIANTILPYLGGTTRVGVDARVGHVISAARDFSIADRGVVNGSAFITADALYVNVNTGLWAGRLERRELRTRKYAVNFALPAKADDPYETKNTSDTSVTAGTRKSGVTIRSGGVLILTAGDYFFDSLSVDSGGILRGETKDGPVRVFVRDSLNLNGRVEEYYNSAPAADVGPSAEFPNTKRLPAKILIATLAQNVYPNSGFEGILLAPNANVGVQGWGSTMSLVLRGAVIGKSVTLHQGGGWVTSFAPEVLWPEEIRNQKQGSGPGAADAVQPYVSNLGFLDGTNCEYWPKDLTAEAMGTRLASAPSATKDDIQTVITRLKTIAHKETGTLVTAFGSPRELQLAFYEEVDRAENSPQRRWVAIDPDNHVGYDISYQRLCTEDEMKQSLCELSGRDIRNANGDAQKYQIVGLITQRERMAQSESDAEKAVMLIAPSVSVTADLGPIDPRKGTSGEREPVDLNVSLVVAAIHSFSGNFGGGIEIKPYTRVFPETWTTPEVVRDEIDAAPRRGLLAVFAGSVTGFTRTDVNNSLRLVRIGFHEEVGKPSLWQYRMPDYGNTLFNEVVLPVSFAVGTFPATGPTQPQVPFTSSDWQAGSPYQADHYPPDYFKSQWSSFPYGCSWEFPGGNDRHNQWGTCTYNGKTNYCGYFWTQCNPLVEHNYCNDNPFVGWGSWQTGIPNLWTFKAQPMRTAVTVGPIPTSVLIGDQLKRRKPETGGSLFIFTASGSSTPNANAWLSPSVQMIDYHANPLDTPAQAKDQSTYPFETNRPPSSWANAQLAPMFTAFSDKIWTFDYRPGNYGPKYLGPDKLRCPSNSFAQEPRIIDNRSYYSTHVTIDLNQCWGLSSVTATTEQAVANGAIRSRVLPVAQKSYMGRALVAYLYDIIQDHWLLWSSTLPQDKKILWNPELAHSAAQVLSSGYDRFDLVTPQPLKSYFFSQYADSVDTSSLKSAVAAPQYGLLLSMAQNIDPTAAGAMGISQDELARVVRMADSVDPAFQGPRLNALGKPYGKFAAPWASRWAYNDRTGSAFSLADVQTRWGVLREQSLSLRNALAKALDTTQFDIALLKAQMHVLTGAIASHASTVGNAAGRQMLDDTQAISTLATAINSLKTKVTAYRETLCGLYGVSSAPTDGGASGCTWEALGSAANEAVLALNNKCSDPMDFFQFVELVAKIMPVAAAVAEGLNIISDAGQTGDLVQTIQNAFRAVNNNGMNALKDLKAYSDGWDDLAGLFQNASKVASGMSEIAGKIKGTFRSGAVGWLNSCGPDSLEKQRILTIMNAQATWAIDLDLAETNAQTIKTMIDTLWSQVEYQATNAGSNTGLYNTMMAIQARLDQIQVSATDPEFVTKRNTFLVNACRAFRTGAQLGEQDLYAVSQMLQTTEGRAPTSPALIVTANGRPDQTGPISQDKTFPFLTNVWDPNGFDAFSSAAGVGAYLGAAKERFETLIHTACGKDPPTNAPARTIFMVTRHLTAAELESMRSDGYVQVWVGLDDLAEAVSQDETHINPFEFVTASDATGDSPVPFAAPVVLGVRYSCPGGCSLPPTYLANSGYSWVPNVPSVPAECPGWIQVSVKKPLASTQVLTCMQGMNVPKTYDVVTAFENGSDLATTLKKNTDLICEQTANVVPLTGFRGVPLMGHWLLAGSYENAQRLVFGSFVDPSGTSTPMPPPQGLGNWPIPASGLDVIFFVAADVKAKNAPASYMVYRPKLQTYLTPQ